MLKVSNITKIHCMRQLLIKQKVLLYYCGIFKLLITFIIRFQPLRGKLVICNIVINEFSCKFSEIIKFRFCLGKVLECCKLWMVLMHGSPPTI